MACVGRTLVNRWKDEEKAEAIREESKEVQAMRNLSYLGCRMRLMNKMDEWRWVLSGGGSIDIANDALV
jgi:hypothetical protein